MRFSGKVADHNKVQFPSPYHHRKCIFVLFPSLIVHAHVDSTFMVHLYVYAAKS